MKQFHDLFLICYQNWKSSFPNPSFNLENATINKKQTARAAEKSWVSILSHFRQNLACGMAKVA
jgi:hypothetical protein